MKVFVLTVLFLASHFLLAAHWQLEGGKTDLAWVNAKANISAVGSFNLNYKITISQERLYVSDFKNVAQALIEKVDSFIFTSPIYILNCSFLI